MFLPKVIKLSSREGVVICDGLNYIKGFRWPALAANIICQIIANLKMIGIVKSSNPRYELYCASKAGKTTQCTLHCDLSVQDCETWNKERENEVEKWDEEVLAALAMRFQVVEKCVSIKFHG